MSKANLQPSAILSSSTSESNVSDGKQEKPSFPGVVLRLRDGLNEVWQKSS